MANLIFRKLGTTYLNSVLEPKSNVGKIVNLDFFGVAETFEEIQYENVNRVFRKLGLPGNISLLTGRSRASKIILKEFFGETETGKIMVYTSTGWKAKPVKHFDDTFPVEKPLKMWDGTNWSFTLQ